MDIQESKNKTYSAVELLDFPIGTKFKISSSGNLVEVGTVDKIKGIFTVNNKGFCWDKEKCIPFNELWLTTEFIKILQPVSFMDVVNSNKKCKVEYGLVTTMLISKDITFDKYFIDESFSAMQRDEYIYFDRVVLVLSKYLGAEFLRKVIKEGKWYLEDDVDE